jgi:hypothetical protein
LPLAFQTEEQRQCEHLIDAPVERRIEYDSRKVALLEYL